MMNVEFSRSAGSGAEAGQANSGKETRRDLLWLPELCVFAPLREKFSFHPIPRWGSFRLRRIDLNQIL